MKTPTGLLEKRQQNSVREGLTNTGLYHSFRLPDGRTLKGAMTLEFLQSRVDSFQLPEDLRHKRVLDIGPWDGFMTFEMERRGAEVMAIDYVDLDTFRAIYRAFNSRADYRKMDVYELDARRVGYFDIVLCLGVLYHLKHPLLALEKICAITQDVCIVETVVIDGEEWLEGWRPPLPYAEFYERDELAGQQDNWCGPTVAVVEAWIRAAGFASAQILRVASGFACFAAHRKWRDLPAVDKEPAKLLGLTVHSTKGKSFLSSKEEYIETYLEWQGKEAPSINDVFPEVDGYGVAPFVCTLKPDGLLVSMRVPPGLPQGRHEARVKIGRSGWSEAREFFMDLEPVTNEIVIGAIQDGTTWQSGRVDWGGAVG